MKRLSLASRLRLLTLKTGECHQWIGQPSMRIRIGRKLRDVREVAAELAGIKRKPGKPFLAYACKTSRCINPLHAPVKR